MKFTIAYPATKEDWYKENPSMTTKETEIKGIITGMKCEKWGGLEGTKLYTIDENYENPMWNFVLGDISIFKIGAKI